MKLDFSDAITGSNPLLDRAEVALRRKIEANPADQKAIWNLAEVLRQQGRLDDALACYRELSEASPEYAPARHLIAILSGEVSSHSAPETGPRPVPFLRRRDFLSAEEQARVWNLVKRHEERFSSSKVGKDNVNPDYRSSHVLYKKELGEIAPWFLARVEEHLPDLCHRFGVEPFEVRTREIQLTMHLHGEFFKVHQDSGKRKPIDSRKMTFVYYFHQIPRRFEGGDLLLFDTDPVADKCFAKYSRLAPHHNSVVFFPSHFFHQVTPVTCPTDNYMDGRFTLNGWLHDEKHGDDGTLL